MAIKDILENRIYESAVFVKNTHIEELSHIETIKSGHPIPDDISANTAHEIARFCRKGNENTLFSILISRGGSSLLSYPLE